MRFRTPANVLLRRAQLILMLVTLVPTVLLSAVGIVLLALGAGGGVLYLVSGVLILTFATTAISGYILSTIFVSRGASMARVQSDFLSLASHELRTPLTSIHLFIESLRDDRLTDEADKQRCLDLLDQEVQRLGTLVERLMTLSKLEAGSAAFEFEPVEAKELVSEALAQLNATAIPDVVEVEVSADNNLIIDGDRSSLVRAIANLLINAWKYTKPEGRKIEIRAYGVDKWAFIEVSDNGPGIPRAEQKRIFEKFERGQQAIDAGSQGTGLGLAMVKATIKAHRGKLELDSAAGRGATFRMKLRRRKPS
ncbi:MAG: HAMP domain-containing histidine kinase [Deltaproteobacteria bacterium]|nr:HAMP domain-containing histidine kinase [Deltaproteobacteria bacterium]